MGRRIGLASIKHKDPGLFDFETDEFLNVTGADPHRRGRRRKRLPIRSSWCTYAVLRAAGHSDLRACYKRWWAKDIILRFLSSYLERFGTPVVKGTYRRGMTTNQQDDLLRALEGIQRGRHCGAGGRDGGLLQASAQGEQGFTEAIAYHDRQIAKAILGETDRKRAQNGRAAGEGAPGHDLLRLQKISAIWRRQSSVSRCSVRLWR